MRQRNEHTRRSKPPPRRTFPDAATRCHRRHATSPQRPPRHRRHSHQAKRVVGRTAGLAGTALRRQAIKDHTLRHLDFYLEQFEAACTRAGGHVHWASDADEANRIIIDLMKSHGGREVIKVKTMTSDETQLNVALEAAGITPYETDLADLIVQLGDDKPSHIVVPALHRNRIEIRASSSRRWGSPTRGRARGSHRGRAPLSAREVPAGEGRNQRRQLHRRRDRRSVCVVESEGNGRMCVTLPDVLITLVGIEKIIPTFRDLEVFLQLLPRSATGERMNPYNSIWTGVTRGDGPQQFHVVLLDNGRTGILADAEARETLDCIRCGACLNACPVYRQTGGHAYGSIYSGPIGAIVTPQLQSHAALADAALRLVALRRVL